MPRPAWDVSKASEMVIDQAQAHGRVQPCVSWRHSLETIHLGVVGRGMLSVPTSERTRPGPTVPRQPTRCATIRFLQTNRLYGFLGCLCIPLPCDSHSNMNAIRPKRPLTVELRGQHWGVPLLPRSRITSNPVRRQFPEGPHH